MTQESTNVTFFRQTNQVERANPVDANSVEFIPTSEPPNLATNAKRIWIDMPNEAAYFTVDGIDFIELARKNMIPFINVKDHPYNAVGNGVAQDHNALQSAFDVANTAGGAIIFIPDGTYLNNAYIRLYSNTTVYMAPNAVIKRSGTVNKVFINGEQGNASFAAGYDGVGNVHFYGGTINMSQGEGITVNLTLSAFDLGHGDNLTFRNMRFTNSQIGHIFQVAGCRNVTIDNCLFDSFVWSNPASANYEAIQVETLTAASFPTFGLFDDTPSQNVFIHNCTFDTPIRAVGTHGGAPPNITSDVRVVNCTINAAYEDALHFVNYRNVEISGNTITNTGQNAIYVENVTDALILGNYSNVSGECGLYQELVTRNKSRDNTFLEASTGNSGLFSTIRATDTTDCTWSGDAVTSAVPAYSRPFFISGTNTGHKIITYRFTNGTSGGIGGASPNFDTLQIGNGQEVLFNGDLTALATPTALSRDIREFSSVMVMANDNAGAANMTYMSIPKAVYVTGAATSRYRILLDLSPATDKVDFSFPSATSIQLDANGGGTTRIRQVIGIV